MKATAQSARIEGGEQGGRQQDCRVNGEWFRSIVNGQWAMVDATGVADVRARETWNTSCLVSILRVLVTFTFRVSVVGVCSYVQKRALPVC